MRRKIFLKLLVLSAVLLAGMAACSPPKAVIPTPTPAPTLSPATPTSASSCSVIRSDPTPVATSLSLPPASPADYTRGPEAAPVTLLAYCDFQSAQCEIFNRALDQLQNNHPNDLKVVYRPFPVPSTVVASLDKSQLSVQAALAAGDQNKFWQMRELLQTQYAVWTKLPAAAFGDWIVNQATGLGFDSARFKQDLTSAETLARSKSLYEEATNLGISALPTVFINGTLQSRAAMTIDGLDSTIGLIALGTREYKSCPPFDIDVTKQYTATIHTEKGDILVQLFPDKAPLAVNSFVFLARNGWYDGVTFHRVIPGFVAQAGDPSGTGRGGPGYYFKNEIREDLLFNKPGILGMANSGPDTNGSQFFITYAAEPSLDGKYTIFGQVIEGMDIVEKLTPRDPQTATTALPAGDRITGITIEEK